MLLEQLHLVHMPDARCRWLRDVVLAGVHVFDMDGLEVIIEND